MKLYLWLSSSSKQRFQMENGYEVVEHQINFKDHAIYGNDIIEIFAKAAKIWLLNLDMSQCLKNSQYCKCY